VGDAPLVLDGDRGSRRSFVSNCFARLLPLGLCAGAALASACDGGGRFYCANATCVCGPGAECDLGCGAPPCHISCGQGSQCSGTCANGTCSCDPGAECNFDCASGPCHVQCAGDNPTCDGVCANGSCVCGPHSNCHFSCLDHNCHASCAPGSSCTLDCPQGNAGKQGCDFSACAAGAPVMCANGTTLACGAPCP
jgi:hypothetical protein